MLACLTSSINYGNDHSNYGTGAIVVRLWLSTTYDDAAEKNS